MKNKLPGTLKVLRMRANRTQLEIADNIGVTQRAYSFYETGDREPDIDTLIKMAEYYKIPLDVLVGRYTMPGLLEPDDQEKDTNGNATGEFTVEKTPDAVLTGMEFVVSAGVGYDGNATDVVNVQQIAPKRIGTSGYNQGGIFIYDEWV